MSQFIKQAKSVDKINKIHMYKHTFTHIHRKCQVQYNAHWLKKAQVHNVNIGNKVSNCEGASNTMSTQK